MEVKTKYQERIYKYSEACVFRKTKELFGGLSNMASGFPVRVNGKHILTSEALYQICRFPHLPHVQQKIILEKSPMTAKMVGKPFRNNSRPDWDNVRTDIMYWCLKVKLAQNFISFGQLLESTYDKSIVEDSSKDSFWGAIQDKKDERILKGVNALGRLLMKLRQEYNSPNRFDLLCVKPLNIPDFKLLDVQIQTIDERQSFISSLYKKWEVSSIEQIENTIYNAIITDATLPFNGNNIISTVHEQIVANKRKAKPTKAKTKKEKGVQPKLPL